MTRLQSLIKEVLSQPKKKDCNCGCNDCGGKAPILTEGKVKHLISEGLQYHMDKKIQLHESVYRIGSEKHFELIREARALWVRGIIDVSEDDQAILETHLGNFGMYEGESVPLDMPMVDEGFYSSPSDLEDSGLNVIPKDQIHANKLQDALKNSGLYGEWNPREGYFFFPEEEDGYDYLEEKIQELMDDYNIQGYIEGVFEESLNEVHKLLRQTKLSSEEYQKAKKLKGFNADDYTFSSDNNLYVKKSSLEEKKKAKKKKKDPPIGKPKRGGPKAYYVYVRDPKTKRIKKVTFGSGGLRAKIRNPKARNAFAKRHRCSEKNDRTKPSYWSCRLPRYAKQLGLGANMNTFW